MEIKEFLSLMRRRAWLIVLSLALGTVLGLLIAKIQTPVYEATTKVLVSRTRQQTSADMVPMSDSQLVATYLEILRTQQILNDASSQLGFVIDPDAIQTDLINTTQIIQVKVQDKNPQRAVLIANTLVEILVQKNETLQSSQYLTAENALSVQIDQAQVQIKSLQGQISEISEANIQEQLTQVNQQIDQLTAGITQLEQDIAAFPTSLTFVQRASLTEKQSQLNQLRSLLNLYQQIQTNLTFIGKPGQSGTVREDPNLTSIQATLNLYQQLYLNLLNNLEEVHLAHMQNTPNVVQIDPAATPENPIRPVTVLYLAVGLMSGLLLSVALILFIDYFDLSLKTSAEVEEVLNMPVLGTVSNKLPLEEGMISLADTKSTNAEDFRSLAVSVELLCKEKHIRTLLLTNIGPVGDKEAVAANLAIAYAQQSKRVLLIDANLKSPRLHSVFGIENQKGILDTFSENADIKGICQSPKDIVGLSVITGGLASSDSVVWLDPDKLAQLLVKLHKLADLVIINGPSAEVADAQILASKTDGVLLVAELNVTQVESALEARKRFQLIKAEMIGVVLNKPARPKSLKKINLPHNLLSRKDESSPETKYLPSTL